MKLTPLLLFLFLPFIIYANNTNDEINHLLNYIKTTQCLYIRNSDTHNGIEAVKHIQKKYDYYKDEIHNAEDFIRLSATKSLMSGNKYFIQCPKQKKVPSATWLLAELQDFRQNKEQ